MQRIQQSEIQQLELEVLKAFKKLANRHNIRYFLACGTLLGAIRHKGFIPWDDDIDIWLPKDDYRRLIEVVKKNSDFEEGKYKIYLPNDKNYIYPFIKMVNTETVVYEKMIKREFCLGVWIDIFPLNDCVDDNKEFKKLIRKQFFYSKMAALCVVDRFNNLESKYKVKRALSYPAFKVLNIGKDYTYWVNKNLRLVKDRESKSCSSIIWNNGGGDRDRFLKEWFIESIDVPFEDDNFPVPKEYHKVLTKIYGDYMTIPDEKNQVRHDFEGYVIKK
jgi:LPS biosynthesis protein